MTAVLAVGFAAEPFLPGEAPVVPLPISPARDDLAGLVASLRDALHSQGAAIAIHCRRAPEPALQRLGTARAALDGQALACHATSLPPLAGAVLCSLAAALSTRLPEPGRLLAALPALERELLWITWLGSVRGLREPAPTLAQQGASLMPGRAFAASSWPQPAVHTLTRDRPVPLPEAAQEFHLAIAARDGDVAWMDNVALSLDSPPTRHYDPTPTGPQWWSTSRLVEAVAYPVALDVLAGQVGAGLSLDPCRWCGQPVASAPCPFCGYASPSQAPQPPTRAASVPRADQAGVRAQEVAA